MNKIDFVGLISVDHANPNGDPLSGNMPRIDDDSIGEISQNCLRRKIRNRLMDAGYPVFVQSDSNKLDDYTSLAARLNGEIQATEYKTPEELAKLTAKKWLDVRAFGQVLAFNGGKDNSKPKKGSKKAKQAEETEDDEAKSVSAHVRGAVSISPAFSVDPVRIESLQITKSVNGVEAEEGKKGTDTMGMTHRVQYGLYRFHGSISPKLAAKNELTEEDVNAIVEAMRTMFADDFSTARPAGSMELSRLIMINHSSELGDRSTAAINRAIKVSMKDGVEIPRSIDDYDINMDELNNIAEIGYEEFYGL